MTLGIDTQLSGQLPARSTGMPRLRWRLLLAFALFAAGLPWAGYGRAHLSYDAEQYWELFARFSVDGHFSLLNYNDAQRGYAGPLALLPAHALVRLTRWPALVCTGLWGAGWAAVLCGWLLPTGWRQAGGGELGGRRWAVLLALVWVFWRGYFYFPLLDAATVVLFGTGLVLLWERRPWQWAAAGLALGLAVNMRPSYLVSLPVALFIAYRLANNPYLRAAASRLGSHGRLLALAGGMALALAPQLLINARYFGSYTPLVLFRDPADARPVYLRALGWGTRVERYETGFFPGGHRTLLVPDSAGIRQMQPFGPRGFAGYGQYAQFVAHHPVSVAGRYVRHLAHTFDLWYATPYPLARHWPGQWPFRLLNYAVLGLGLLGLWRLPGRENATSRLVLLALGLQVLLTVPFHVETRYGMPVHLVLLLGAAGGRLWAGPWPARRVAQWALLAGLWLGGWAWQAQRQERAAVYDPPGLET